MGRPRTSRTAAIIAASAVIHMVLLAALAIEATRPRAPPAQEPPDIVVSLEQFPKPPPAPKSPARMPQTAHAPAPARAPSPALAVHAPPVAAPVPAEIGSGETAAMGDVVRALRGSVGCSNPDAANLNPAEREACRRRFHAGLETARPMLGLTAEKRARFDQVSRCQEVYRAYKEAPMPNGHAASNGAGGMPGLGRIPSPRDCAGP